MISEQEKFDPVNQSRLLKPVLLSKNEPVAGLLQMKNDL